MEKTVEETSQNEGWSDISGWSIAQKINRLYVFLMSNHKNTLWFYVFLLLAGGVLLHIAYPAPHTTNTHSSESDIDNAVTHDQQYHFSASEASEETDRSKLGITPTILPLWGYCLSED